MAASSETMALPGKRLCGGRGGASRDTGAKNLSLRPASASDAQILLDWKNDPVARENSFNPNPVSPGDHAVWFSSALRDPNIRIHILEWNGEPLGQIRINITGATGLISYSIDEKHRGRGLGKKIVALLEEECRNADLVSVFRADVKKHNVASQRVFESLGYEKNEKRDCIEYEKHLRAVGSVPGGKTLGTRG